MKGTAWDRLSLMTNTRLGWKWLSETNALGYTTHTFVTTRHFQPSLIFEGRVESSEAHNLGEIEPDDTYWARV